MQYSTLRAKINVVFINEPGVRNFYMLEFGANTYPQFLCETKAFEIMVIISCSYVPHSTYSFSYIL